MMGESWEWIMARNEREGGRERGVREQRREKRRRREGERRESVLTYISSHEFSP